MFNCYPKRIKPYKYINIFCLNLNKNIDTEYKDCAEHGLGSTELDKSNIIFYFIQEIFRPCKNVKKLLLKKI